MYLYYGYMLKVEDVEKELPLVDYRSTTRQEEV